MRPIHDVAAVRAAEGVLLATLPEGVLMDRAAAGLARRCCGLLGRVYGSRVVLLVGAGKNGGDTLLAGARLAARGARVDAVLAVPDRAHVPGLAAFTGAGGRAVPHAADGSRVADLIERADLVVDGLVGIGGSGPLREPYAGLAALVNDRKAPGRSAAGPLVVAVDLPSGVDADTGRVAGEAVRADVTVTFGTRKPGVVIAPGADHAGLVECVDIGLAGVLPPARLHELDADDVAALLPVPGADSDKYRRGVVGLLAGSDAYTGAAVLATGGALRAGAGMVRYVGVGHPAEQVRSRWPEAVVTVVPAGAHGTVADPDAVLAAGRVQAWVVGPGLGTDDDVARVVAAVLATDLPVLVDADALTVVAAHPDWLRRRAAPTLITPHAGEFARLTGTERADVEADRLERARWAAADLGVTVLLKGMTTLVVDPDGQAMVNPTGTPWLATAGSGDVLSGAAGGLLAAGLGPLRAGAVAAFVHGLAGRLAATPAGGAGAPITAAEVLTSLAHAERVARGRATSQD